MLTLFTVPKAFRGRIADIQRNAIESWRALHPDVQVVLVGDEFGVPEAAREAGVVHVGELALNERGTPRLDSAFARVDDVARHGTWCFVNADIVLLDDFVPAIERVSRRFSAFLMVGESRDLNVTAAVRFADPDVREAYRREALDRGRLRGYAAMDYFVFPRGHFGDLPPFLIGRACFDNWLVWRARQYGPVVDATRIVVSIHQSHDYGHVAGGLEEAYYGDEAKYNERLAGGRSRIYSLHDATHRLSGKGVIYRYFGSTLRARENARKARVSLQVRREARREARRNRVRPLKIVGVFPEPTGDRSRVLDAAAEARGVDLSVLYSAAGESAGRGHTHWTMRSIHIRRLEGFVGDEHVTPAIWRALYRLRPDCLLMEESRTFASRAAAIWCRLRGIPYLVIGTEAAPSFMRRAAAVVVSDSAVRKQVMEVGVDAGRTHLAQPGEQGLADAIISAARAIAKRKFASPPT